MAVRDDFGAGEVLAAADLNDTFASKVDYALPTNAQTGTTYTFVAADAEKLTTASNAAAVTLTIPPASSVAWPDNTVLRVVNYGAGAVTIDGGSGVTVTNTSSTVAQYGAAVAIRTGSDAWTVVPFGDGDVPSATVSSPSATGQYTDTGVTYDYYTFTSSGTLTVDTAGLADVLIIAGGGGGGGPRDSDGGGGGGGAGGYFYLADYYLSATTYTVTVGAGGNAGITGSGATTQSRGGKGNSSGITNAISATGGGGGGGYGANGEGISDGSEGGSSGGAGGYNLAVNVAGFAVAREGNTGGTNAGPSRGGGGGGGSGGAGGNAAGGNTAGAAGAGTSNSITGSAVTRAAGGAGGANGATSGGAAGGANTGTGGGGGTQQGGISYAAGAGGSGVVIVRVKV